MNRSPFLARWIAREKERKLKEPAPICLVTNKKKEAKAKSIESIHLFIEWKRRSSAVNENDTAPDRNDLFEFNVCRSFLIATIATVVLLVSQMKFHRLFGHFDPSIMW